MSSVNRVSHTQHHPSSGISPELRSAARKAVDAASPNYLTDAQAAKLPPAVKAAIASMTKDGMDAGVFLVSAQVGKSKTPLYVAYGGDDAGTKWVAFTKDGTKVTSGGAHE